MMQRAAERALVAIREPVERAAIEAPTRARRARRAPLRHHPAAASRQQRFGQQRDDREREKERHEHRDRQRDRERARRTAPPRP